MLVGSTLLTAVFADPVIALLATGTEVHVAGVIATLLIVVVLPFAVGLGVRSSIAPQRRDRAQVVVVAAVAILVWLVASEAHLSAAYLRVLAALALIIVSSSIVGAALGRLVTPPAAVSTVFAASMHDFAIASGIATAAFGAAAAAPLSLYGIMVVRWGPALAGTLRRRQRSRSKS
jgi:predicted Na+-dependent transporter